MSSLTATFLGTGTSHGIPVIGCSCSVCTSTDPHDRRLRSSIYLEDGSSSIVIDTGPEFRLQALSNGITELSAVFYTHDHADHLNGIDDLRPFCKNAALPVYASQRVIDLIRQRFPYVESGDIVINGRPHLDLRAIEAYETVRIEDIDVTAIPIMHGDSEIFAYRVGELAYVTDCSELPQKSVDYLMDLEVLVVGALRRSPHPNHFSLFEALGLIKYTRPKVAYLTHLSHGLSHHELESELPSGVYGGYDGLKIPVGG